MNDVLETGGLLAPVVWIAFALLSAAMSLAFLRLVRGPTLPDRVVALDLMALLCVGYIATYDIATDQVLFLDVALALALIAFLGTTAFARFIEKRGVLRSDYKSESEKEKTDGIH